MPTSALIVALAMSTVGASLPENARDQQAEMFARYWQTDFVWKFDELPQEGTLPSLRVPYSGNIYLDRQGGTVGAMKKYDRAFNGSRPLAESYERYDTTAYKKPTGRVRLFRSRTMETPSWHGHCNGWTAAAIRHAEPQNSVQRNGVVFTPADIKALLAEIYLYNDPEPLAGYGSSINAGLFHAIITNWIGRGSHPIGMEADPGDEKWNYPVYAYACSTAKRSSRVMEVKMNIAYAKDSQGEQQESPRIRRIKYFHYMLYLDDQGRISGGSFARDSSTIDMLWAPVKPQQGGQQGNQRGNQHVDVNEVLAIWRDSVPADTRQQWPIIDPSPEDIYLVTKDAESIVPRGYSVVIDSGSSDESETELTTRDTIEDSVRSDVANTVPATAEQVDSEAASTY
jgi:hypothetical protein